MNKIRTVVVDDEPLARKKIVSFIDKTPELELINSFNNAQDALSFLKEDSNCLVFLDIQMDGMTGIDLLERLMIRPKVIITSAYDEYAVKGFEFNVTDYLLKPFSYERFKKSVEKVVREIRMDQLQAQSDAAYILIKTEYRLEKVDLDSILFIEGMKDYLRIHTLTKKIMTLKSFSALESELPKGQFLRIHKSYMVSLARITSIEKDAVLVEGSRIPVGRSYKEKLTAVLKERGAL